MMTPNNVLATNNHINSKTKLGFRRASKLKKLLEDSGLCNSPYQLLGGSFHVSILIQKKFQIRLFEKWLFCGSIFLSGEEAFCGLYEKKLKSKRMGVLQQYFMISCMREFFFPRACFDYRHYLHFIHSHTFPKNLLMHSRKKIHFRDSSTSLEVGLDKNFSIEFYRALR